MFHPEANGSVVDATPAPSQAASRPDPQVVLKAERRRFSAECKQRVLAEADQCRERGELGALLRREGLYGSHLSKWRAQRERVLREALAPQKRGRKVDPQAAELERLRQENQVLEARLQQAATIIVSNKSWRRCWERNRTRPPATGGLMAAIESLRPLFGLSYDFLAPGQSVLDVGIGIGLVARLFAKAGLRVFGMDFPPAMLEICRAKGVAVELTQHDVQIAPWPYMADAFAHVVCCGVLHFVPDLETVFAETGRVLKAGGLLAFTTKTLRVTDLGQRYEQVVVDGLDVFSHAPSYDEAVVEQRASSR